ncbi:Adenylate kinase 9 [Lonchura striata]|uniref:Adenylate kinase 9 n=1 Tax=Lonchura striata TaxID=40157 RepID=A0A218UZZ5_9PASE|nr:Adenylate kinase 9 [Lonchura striata domestica]
MASQEEKQAQPFADIFDEDEAEKSFLLSKPTCLIVFGKPGSGKKTLASKLAQRWNCIFIEASEVIQTNIQQRTGYGLKCQKLLCQGQSIPEELVTKMILQMINESPEVAHYGKLWNINKLKVCLGINLPCPDYELCQRISGQRQNPDSGVIYQRSQWDPKVTDKRKKEKAQDEENYEEGEGQDEEGEEAETGESPHKKLESFHQLVQRPEDFLENAEKRIGIYKDIMLPPLEGLLAYQDCRYLIEVDGSQQPDNVLEVLDMDKLVQQYKESREKNTEELQKDAVEKAIAAVKNRLGSEEQSEESGACILRRAYLASRNENNSKILERPIAEALEKKEDDARGGMEETLTSEEDQSSAAAEGKEIMQPEFAEDVFPDTEEMKTIKMKIDLFMNDWEKVESKIRKSSQVQVVVLEIAEQTPESLLNQTILVMEKPFKYYGWELSDEDLEEEAQDLDAEATNEEEEGEEKEEKGEEGEEEEDEETIQQKKRHMGDTNHFCPVSLKENFVLYPGLQEYAAKYKEKIYYFSTSEYRDKFLKNPEEYVAHNEPLQAPPLRVCLLGVHGAGKTTCAREITDRLGIFHIQFEEYLQELILPKTKRKVGPSSDGDHEDDNKIPEELEDFSQTITKTETEKTKQEVELTDEEEAIKANLMDNTELPPEVLDKIVPDWWKKEPFRSTGFILDGFPRTSDEASYLSERGLCPDVAVYIQVEEGDILNRLFPPRLKKWKDKQLKKKEYKIKLKELKAEKRVSFQPYNEKIARRREELLAERQKNKQAALADKDDDEATEEEENEDIEAILAEEFLEDEEEEEEPEEEENEEDAVERMQNEISEKFELEIERLQSMQEELEKLLIPSVEINGGRKPRIVCYQIYSKLKSLVENRRSIFEKCYPISLPLAQKMLVFSYKLLSSFGQWDPIKVIHKVLRYHLLEIASILSVFNVSFIFLNKKCRLASVYGFVRLSLGDAIRFVINSQPESELALKVQSHLLQGLTVPDELAIQALDVALLNHTDNPTGVVIDGYPLTRTHVNLLESTRIIPVKIFELDMDTKEVFRRALLDKERTNRLPYPEHDNPQILAIKNSCYKQHIDDIRTYYMKERQNWCVIDANHSKWRVWNTVLQKVQVVVKQIQIYLERRREGKAASIAGLCITPKELQSQLGECGQYCPVSLAEKGELVDCSVTPSLEFAAEFQGHYYRMASQEELEKFLSRPEVYVSSLASHPLPPTHMLPKKLTAAEVKALFPVKPEMQGYCPVTYLDGKQRYEALVPGNIEYAAKYQDKGVATSLIKALHEVGSLKPKFPFLSVKETALLFVSFHLKGTHNPRSSEPVRQMYRKKFLQFVEHCQLIPYLGTAMMGPYKEPRDRPRGLDDRLQTFFSLKGTRPTFV